MPPLQAIENANAANVANANASDANVPCDGDVDVAIEIATVIAICLVSFSCVIFCCFCCRRVRRQQHHHYHPQQQQRRDDVQLVEWIHLNCFSILPLQYPRCRRDSSMNFATAQSHCSVSTGHDVVSLRRLRDKATLSHASTMSLSISSNSNLTADESIQVTRLRFAFAWLLSDEFRRIFICSPGSSFVLRGSGVSIRNTRLALAFDSTTLESLGFLPDSSNIDLSIAVRPAVRAAAASLPQLDALIGDAVWFVDGVQKDIASVIASFDERPIECVSHLHSLVWSHAPAVVRCPSWDDDPDCIVDLVDHCAAIRLGATIPSKLPLTQQSISMAECCGAGLLHPIFIVALAERLLERRNDFNWACLTIGCEPSAEVSSRDAISFLIRRDRATATIVVCGRWVE
jgi:hypothetical protein